MPTQTATPVTSARDPWLDNAKMALVTLVVVGHAWTLLPDAGLTEHLYDFLYAWHVPAFVFVTGYLSQKFAYTKVRMWQLFRTVVVPYLSSSARSRCSASTSAGRTLDDLFQRPALADVVPRRPVLLAAAHPDLPADVGRGRGRRRDQPGRRAVRRRHPRPGPGPRPAAVLRARASRRPRSGSSCSAAGPRRWPRSACSSRCGSSPPGPTSGRAPSGSTTAPATTRWGTPTT